ncbi:MAG: glycosyltransferase family 4 protein [Flavobacteriaceae bacterium]|nr:glycosyltransferase family 4 protein [Flavobacteriaceae bacterium]
MIKKQKIALIGGEDAHKRIALSRLLTQQGYDVSILGSKTYDYPEDIQFIPYNLNRKLNLSSDFKTILEYRRLFANHDFDILQTFDTKPAYMVPLANYFAKKRIIVRTITGLGTVFMSNSIKYKILRLIYILLHTLAKFRVTHTSFQNEDDHRIYLKNRLVNKNNSSLIFGSGIDLKPNYPQRDNARFTFLCVGRLVYEKGIHNYLQAAKLCKERGYDFRFVLIGPLEEDSENLNAEMLEQHKEAVEWLGSRNDVAEWMKGVDAFVLPTFREGFSRVLLEAASFGLPMITTNVPGCKEIVAHDKEGYLIGVNNTQQLADAMIKLASNPQKAKVMGANAFDKVKQFSIEIITEKYITLYRKYENPVLSAAHQ